MIIERSHRIPEGEDDDFDLSYRNAKILIDKGMQFLHSFFVTLPGFEPRSSEPESDILSIELWSLNEFF